MFTTFLGDEKFINWLREYRDAEQQVHAFIDFKTKYKKISRICFKKLIS